MAGRINISAELCRRLSLRGHTLAVAWRGDAGDRIGHVGGEFVPLPVPARINSGSGNVLQRLGTVPKRRAEAVRSLGMDGFVDSLAKFRPDLLLIDVELADHLITAGAMEVPMAGWTSMMSIWKRPGVPPLHTDLVPGVGLRGSRIGIEAAWAKFRLGKWLGNQRRRVSRLGLDRISVLRYLAAEVGYEFDRQADVYQWLVPFTPRSLPVLSFNAFELEFPHEPDPACRYVGPVLNLAAPPPSPEDGDRIADLVERRRRGRSSGLIYSSFGAWHKGDDRDFLARLMTAVEGSRWDMAVGLGGRLGGREGVHLSSSIPDNVHLFDWAPQAELLRHADLAVHHAGISSINECITFGVPMVLYPFGFLDQAGNAARIVFHGLGEVGDRGEDDPQLMRRRFERVLSDVQMKANLLVMRDALAKYQTEDRAVRAIESLL